VLKAIRPEGYRFAHLNPSGGFFCVADGPKQIRAPRLTGFLPTEELAELHAIIQAIEYERHTGAGMVAENRVKSEVDG